MMKKLDNGNLACKLDPGNLFAKAMQICGTDPVSVCAHKKDCAAFWREISIDRWEHGYVGEYLWYWLEGPTQKAKSGTSAVE